ncbi:hypothetical protein FZ934_04790 [Rhizobium grahamii]|uniref:Uncharacterized protein n=1 Tax=Rhizobium grahamii TaxID=1120045 RepID=A0A5Q0C1R1_9HYPH|nr:MULTISPECIES: hypothetical protein [Rhizobium]QFY59808.1 hypothetical protein FZ934_04790 [Rhizobium grahamii]QRM51078.1 hypothetical protein F3Y33_18100 [Rhizobium sp. BG6]
MRKTALLLSFALVASPAMAISRYNSQSMTCQSARAAIHNEGAVIFRYPSKRVPGMPLYDRYVRNSRFCDGNKYAEWTRIPTKDDPSCRVLNCQNIDNLDGMFLVPDYSL